jgi:hypothetical protein
LPDLTFIGRAKLMLHLELACGPRYGSESRLRKKSIDAHLDAAHHLEHVRNPLNVTPIPTSCPFHVRNRDFSRILLVQGKGALVGVDEKWNIATPVSSQCSENRFERHQITVGVEAARRRV